MEPCLPGFCEGLHVKDTDLPRPCLSPTPCPFDTVCDLCDVTEELLFSVVSPLGQVVDVFDSCKRGVCSCSYCIGDVPSQLKPCRFASVILDTEYDWVDRYQSLLWDITDGFPIVDDENIQPYERENYTSITCPENKHKMDDILSRELKEGYVSHSLQKPVCVHALGAVPKGDSKIRQITDCSRPSGSSVNNHCESLLKDFSFKSISTAVDMLSGDEFMSVVDIKSAYRAVPIREAHRKFQGFSWELDGEKCYYVENRLCFGLRLGPSYFNTISCFIHDYLTNVQALKLVNYLDDFLTISENLQESTEARDKVVYFLRFLGFHVAFDKLTYPSKVVIYLGVILDTERCELRLPEGKRIKLENLLNGHIGKGSITKKELESIGGLLSHCSHLVKGGKMFCRNTYELYKKLMISGKKHINLSQEVISDFNWWLRIFPFFNGTVKMFTPEFEYPMLSDSSLKGFAVYMGSDWVAGTWSDYEHIPLKSKCGHVGFRPVWDNCDRNNINELELWPVVIGLKRWVESFRDKAVCVFTDNTQVMFMLLNGSSSNLTCRNWLKEIYWLCAVYNIVIHPKYINTKSNLVADTLSRLPYFKSGLDIEDLIGQSDLCCLDNLFMAYRDNEREPIKQSTDTQNELDSPEHKEG